MNGLDILTHKHVRDPLGIVVLISATSDNSSGVKNDFTKTVKIFFWPLRT